MPKDSSITPGFHAIHANHLEDLRKVVVWICRNNPLPPLEGETFLVQSNGIAQWLKLALAERRGEGAEAQGLGIAAGMDFLFPSRFIWQAYRAVLPPGEVPETSPFDKQELSWRLYRLLPEIVGSHPAFDPLQRFLQGEDTDRRRFQLAEKVADLFDQYQVFRADWLQSWQEGENHISLARGGQRELDQELAWQPLLWRTLLDDVGPGAETSRARIHNRFLKVGMAPEPPTVRGKLPKRIIVFGVSSLPRQTLEALHVLSCFSQIVLCVHNPCRFFWGDIISDRELLRAERKRGAQHPNLAGITDLEQLHQHANPLLAAWGKQGRDYIRLLDEFDNPDDYQASFSTPEQTVDIYSPNGGDAAPKLLHQLQNDVLELRSLKESQAEERELDTASDCSLVFHQAHSPQREVEILHDQLLAAFNADPTLRPRDVIVMVPDINTYAPYIQAVFGLHQPGSTRYIPFTISDQGQRHHQPVVIALETLLSLPRSRFVASDIISLLEVPAVRQRFAIAEEELPLIRTWVDGANIRWGLHSEHRSRLELPAGLERNTWQSGLRAMLLGYAMGDDEAWDSIEPFSDVGGLQAAVVGKLDDFVSALENLWSQLQGSFTPGAWKALLADMLEQFFAEEDSGDFLLLNRFRDQVEQWFDNTQAAGLADQELPLNIVKDIWLEGLDEGGLNQRFLAGKVSFATLMPMRAIPFKIVCLLGMNDGDYPRSRPPVDFDLMAQDYRPGDRSRREDDRYLFLEALLSARERLYISWVGRSIKDDSERPASVLVGQLRDHINSIWHTGTKEKAAEALTTCHPLQPFSRDYFPQRADETELLRPRTLFTYQDEWESAYAQLEDEGESAPIPYEQPEEPISLNELANFLKKPVETFYQRVLQVRFAAEEEAGEDTEAFALVGLEKWELDDELITDCIMKADSDGDFEARVETCLNAMARRGALGMGLTEQTLRETLANRLPNMFERYQKAIAAWPQQHPEPIIFDYGYTGHEGSVEINDMITDIRCNASGNYARVVLARSSLLENTNTKKKPPRYPNLLRDWVIHLAGQLSATPFETHIIAKEEDKTFSFPKLDRQEAQDIFEAILQQWMKAHMQPLPLQAEAGFKWVALNEKDEEKALQEAEAVYHVALMRDPGYLNGAFPDAEEFIAKEQFRTLAAILYEPLVHVIGEAH